MQVESISLGTCKMWSLYTGGLYIQVVFRVSSTVNQRVSQMIVEW